ncbi:Transcription termination/antitermination protein NusA [Candidatus Entotheonellaceae bacterium PAL068K]
MNQELLHLINQISREKGIERSVLIDAVQSAVCSAARKRFGTADNLSVRLDETTGTITSVFAKVVVPEDDLVEEHTQIGLVAARALDPLVTVGDTVEITHEIGDFGRIAAQAAKQVIIQKVREAERDMVYREFKERQGDLVNGTVARVEREGNLIVDLGKTEALLPRREQSFRETFQRGDRIRAYIIEVKRSSSGHQVILSRTHPGFLIQLFELEVPEIYEGIVEIKEAVRDSSGRAKIAVVSTDRDVDPVGACVGMKGMRVQAVVQELRGEKIDIIPWTDDEEQFVRNALSPAKVTRVLINDSDRTMRVVVPDDQLSLAIGKRGQNVRLAAKLTRWKIDIKCERDAEDEASRQETLRRVEMAFNAPQRSVAPPELASQAAQPPTEASRPASQDMATSAESASQEAMATEMTPLPTVSEDEPLPSSSAADVLSNPAISSVADSVLTTDETSQAD